MKIIWLLFLFVGFNECARIRNSGSKNRESRYRTRILRPRGEGLEDLFNVYDPSFLAVVWPKITNGVHLFLDPRCWQDLSVFFKDLADGRAWAYNVMDASGRYESGLFDGNKYWLGSKAECLQLDNGFIAREGNETVDEFQNGDYLNAVLRREKYFQGDADEWRSLVRRDELFKRLVAADHTAPHRLAYNSIQLSLNLTKITMAESYGITLGVCLPRSCSADDVVAVMNFSIMINDNLKTNKTIPRSVRVNSLRKVEETYSIRNDMGAVLLILITLILLVIITIATVVDFDIVRCKSHNSKSMSFDLQKFNNNFDTENKTMHDENKLHTCDVLAKKESNVVDMETLTINNISNSNNINLVTVKKVVKPNVIPPSITLDVVSMERVTGSCKRCGKYKKQCTADNLRHNENLAACPRVKSFASMTTEPKKKEKFFKSLLQCFSLRYSWKRIFNTNMANKDLSFIHLLRIIATFWILFLHIAVIANYVSDNGGNVNEYNNVYYTIATGTLAFDTLFFVRSSTCMFIVCFSGLFSSHHFFYLKSQYTVEELVSFGGACGQILQFICFVSNRAIRLLPSYAYVLFLSAVLSRRTYHTSVLALPEADEINCDQYWWRNLLYLTTLFPKEQQCMQISWVLSAETQLHVFGALACSLSASGRRLIFSLVVAAIIIATAADVSSAFAEFGLYMSSPFAAYTTLIERPLGRVAPYFIGVFAGWLLQRLEGRLHISKTKASILWLWSLSILATCVTLPWVVSAWWCSWQHVLWPLALLWPATIFATRLGSVIRHLLDSSFIAALSRLCYCILLLHGVISRSVLLADSTLCSDYLCIWSYTAGVSILTVLSALVLSLLVETPCCSLLRRLSDYAA